MIEANNVGAGVSIASIEYYGSYVHISAFVGADGWLLLVGKTLLEGPKVDKVLLVGNALIEGCSDGLEEGSAEIKKSSKLG